MRNRARARELAAQFSARGDPTGWFEALYQEAEEGKSEVPWADLRPNLHLLDFWKAHPLEAAGKSALVIGSGLGDDAEQLAAWGFQATAFDISPTAIRASRKRFPASRVEYVEADLFSPPPARIRGFDFVLETYTLQALPENIRAKAFDQIAAFLRSGGQLLVIAVGREDTEPPGDLPWPLTRAEFEVFTRSGLQMQSFEDFQDPYEPPIRWFRALFKRP